MFVKCLCSVHVHVEYTTINRVNLQTRVEKIRHLHLPVKWFQNAVGPKVKSFRYKLIRKM